MSANNSFTPGCTGTGAGSDVLIAHLDYGYVKDCTNAKELEKIIMVLRSGSEGYYPDLLEFTEMKLQGINPKSDVLQKGSPAQNVKDLDADDKKTVTEDLLNWMNEASEKDKKLLHSNGEADVNDVDGLPPVRSKKTIVDEKNETAKPNVSTSKKRVKPREYKEWDKLDIDKELDLLENDDKKEEQSKPESDESKSKIKMEPVSTKDLSAEERLVRATNEKEKGNEAFKAQDYDEAVVYYTNSLKYEPTAASYNNRAAAELKIGKYLEAIDDCVKVLEIEPNNIKAFLRRGMAYKALKNQELAVKDFNSMLRIDPNNKRAKDLLAEIEISKRESEKTKPEAEGVEENNPVIHEPESKENAGAKTRRKGQRLKIVEIESGDDVTGENHSEQQNSENGKLQENNSSGEGERSDLETSKGILEDLKVVNSVEGEQEGHLADNMVNGETSDSVNKKDNLTMAEEPGTAAGSEESGTENDVVRSIATTSGDKNEPLGQPTSENGDSSDEAAKESLLKTEEVQIKQAVVLEIPEEVKNLMKEGNALYKMGHHSEALVKYTKCVENLWEDRDSYASAVSGLFNNKAACYFKMGECKQCVLQCNESLKLVDSNLKALLRRGTAYEAMEKYAEAFRDFNRVRLIDGSNKIAQEHCSRVIKHLEMLHGKYWRKKIFEISGDDEDKKLTFPDVSKTNKDSVQPSVNKSDEKPKLPEKTSQQPENNQNAGEKGTKTGVKEDEKEESEANVKAQFLKLKESGNLLVKKGKHEEAVKHYTECTKLCPKEVAIYTNRALCYLKLTQYDLAEADCNTALTIENENIKALFRRGKARKGLGRYRDASDDLIQVLKLDSKNKAANSELKKVLDLLKKEKMDENSATKKGETSSKKEKSGPKRKKILIQDIGGDDDNKTGASTQKHSGASVEKHKDTLKAEQKQNAEAKENGKPSDPSPKEKTKPKENLDAKNTKGNSKASVQYNVTGASTQKHSGTSAEKHKDTPKADQKQNPKAKAKKSTPVHSPKENGTPSDLSPKEKTKPKENLDAKNTKGNSKASVQYNVKSAFSFLQAWESVKSNKSERLKILKQVNLAELPKLLSSKLDGEMIKSIFEALNLEMENEGDVKFVYKFLQRLTCVERFEMAVMFLSSEKQVLQNLFDNITKQINRQTSIKCEDLSKLRQAYKL